MIIYNVTYYILSYYIIHTYTYISYILYSYILFISLSLSVIYWKSLYPIQRLAFKGMATSHAIHILRYWGKDRMGCVPLARKCTCVWFRLTELTETCFLLEYMVEPWDFHSHICDGPSWCLNCTAPLQVCGAFKTLVLFLYQ